MIGVGNTVDAVLGTFTKAVARLDAICEREKGFATTCEVRAAALTEAADGHIDEADRATRVADKIRELVS